MISVDEATQIVLAQAEEGFGEEKVHLTEATGRVLREQIFADRDFPPFHRVMMDGIAIAYDTFEQGQRLFPIQGMQAAGSPVQALESEHFCLEVMTGAVLPQGTDTVIRYEDLDIANGQARITVDDVKLRQHVHLKGTDRREGAVLLEPGRRIRGPEIGLAATVGKDYLQVAALPKTLLISTGDELVDIDEKPAAHQIRTSNVYAIQAVLQQWGINARLLHLPDELERTQARLKQSLEQFELIILTGGVSKGKMDYVPEALANLGVEKLFHRVAQRPGKPFWFGQGPTGAIVFALPGNPVSSYMCTLRYLLPWLRQRLQQEALPYRYARLSEDFSFKPSLTYFLQVSLGYGAHGQLLATPVPGRGSGDLANLPLARAFLELPADRSAFKEGEVFPALEFF